MTDEHTPRERMADIRRQATNARRWEILSGILTNAKALGTPEQITIMEPDTTGGRWRVRLRFPLGAQARAWADSHGGTWETSISDGVLHTAGRFTFLTALAHAFALEGSPSTPQPPIPAGPRDASGDDSNSGPGWPLGPAGYVTSMARSGYDQHHRRLPGGGFTCEQWGCTHAAAEAADEASAAEAADEQEMDERERFEQLHAPRSMWTGTPIGHGPGALPHGYVPGACGDECNNGQCPAGRPHDVCVPSCLTESPGQGIPPAAAGDDDDPDHRTPGSVSP